MLMVYKVAKVSGARQSMQLFIDPSSSLCFERRSYVYLFHTPGSAPCRILSKPSKPVADPIHFVVSKDYRGDENADSRVLT